MKLKNALASVMAATVLASSLLVPAFAASATEEENGWLDNLFGKTQYVMMNIPYADFYAAELNNDVPVDGFTSATKNKPRTGTLAAGSYHVDPEGTDITGITFPVKVNSNVLKNCKQVTDADSVDITVTNRGQANTTTYTGVDALFENESYAYYVLDTEPACYKELTVGKDGSFQFGTVQNANVQKVSDASAVLNTVTTYGDYQITVNDLGLPDDVKVYAVILKTTDGSQYGLRHMENIWRNTSLAFCTGFTEMVHNCPTSSAHYESIMGKTISGITYYTSAGNFEVDTMLEVPAKTAESAAADQAAAAAARGQH